MKEDGKMEKEKWRRTGRWKKRNEGGWKDGRGGMKDCTHLCHTLFVQEYIPVGCVAVSEKARIC